MAKALSVVPVSSSDEEILGVATIDMDEHHATIEIDFRTPAGRQLLEFFEQYPELLGIHFSARNGRRE